MAKLQTFTFTNAIETESVNCCRCCIVAQEGRTALHIAAERGDKDLCHKLVEAGTTLDLNDLVGPEF